MTTDPAAAAAPSVFTNEELWRHPDPRSTRMWDFLEAVNKKHHLDLKDYQGLHKWSTDHISAFWEDVAAFTGLKANLAGTTAVDESAPMFPRPPFFAGGLMNFSENMLYPPGKVPHAERAALIAATETRRETVTWSDLRRRVAQCQGAMEMRGVTINDRVAAYVGNHADAIVFMLAATAIGAIWTAISPDSGVAMVLDRLKQIEPKLLLADASQEYNGKSHDILPKIRDVVKELPSITTLVIKPDVTGSVAADALKPEHGAVYSLKHFLDLCPSAKGERPHFAQLSPDHPVYILYSSGTTGAPKCIVHGAVGTLLQHKKEHEIQSDIRPGDKLFYFTTVSWMMWHWLVGALASGATLVLYDGSPMRYRSSGGSDAAEASSQADDLGMPRLISELRVTHFGTSAKYLSLLEQRNAQPQHAPAALDLSSLRAIYSTASPLAPSTFRYVYAAFPRTLNLASITGGTDIVSLFGAPCPLVPVVAGEVQAPGLGMAVRAFDPDSPAASPADVTAAGTPGDLVCVRAFPCMPLGFWPLGGAQPAYRAAYFARFTDPPVWHHGDYVAANPATGGLAMLGRSDGVLNPAGVRFGSAEIYGVLQARFAGAVADALCVGRRRPSDADEAVLLFVKLAAGRPLDDALADAIRAAIRADLSARHVPATIAACPDVPVTPNGKKVEGVVKRIVGGDAGAPAGAVANPESLEFFREWARAH